MRATDRSLDIVSFVSEHFRDIIRRRLSELAGIALIVLALLGALALATWSVQDPSLSHATQKPIHNLLGFPGAIFSDLAMQLLGLAARLGISDLAYPDQRIEALGRRDGFPVLLLSQPLGAYAQEAQRGQQGESDGASEVVATDIASHDDWDWPPSQANAGPGRLAVRHRGELVPGVRRFRHANRRQTEEP